MKRNYLPIVMLALILSIFSLSYADTVQVGSGTTSSSSLPIYGSYSYSYSQQIYTQAQINYAGPITKIRFYYSSGNIANSKDWTIWMGHTTKTLFTNTSNWETPANLTQVFDGDVSSLVPASAGWMEITLDAPFNYNNTNNLLIAVHQYTPGYEYMSWGSFNCGAQRGMYYSSDSTNPNPNSPPTASSRSRSINYIQLVFPNTSAPLAPVLQSPVNGAYYMDGDRLTWAHTLGGGDANDFSVYLGTNADPPLVASNVTATSYLPTLLHETTYYWKVVANNEIGSSPASDVWSFRTSGPNNLVESFEDTTFPPIGWSTDGWTRTSVSYHGGASAYKYGSSDTQYLLSTPLLTIEGNSRLNFWARCSNASATMQVVYSADRINWNQLGGYITFTDAANTWINQDIDLSSLSGANYYLGLQTGLFSANYYVDAFVGPKFALVRPDTPTLTAPEDEATEVIPNPTFTWTAAATGGIPASYNIYCDTNPSPTALIGTSTTTSFTPDTALPFSTTLYWTVTAVNAEGESVAATPRSFTVMADPTVYTYPYNEGFEEGQTHDALVKGGWAQHLDDNKTRYWMANSTNTDYNRTPRNGDFNATLQWNGNAWLMRPFSMQGGTSYDVEVWARQDGTSAANASVGFYYGIENTIAGMTNTIVNQTGIVDGNYQRIWGSFTPETTGIYWIAIHGVINSSPYYISIDDIMVQPTPTTPVLSYTPDAIDFGVVMYNTLSNPVNVNVTNAGPGTLNLGASDISIIGPNAAEFSFDATNLPASLIGDQSVNIPVTVQGVTEGPISATLRMVYNAENYDVPLSANVLPEGTVVVGDGTGYNIDTNYPCVYGGWYKNSREQYILTAAELTALGAQPGLIKTISFNVYNPNTSANLPNFTISMGTTVNTEFPNTTFLTDLTEVYSAATYTPTAGWNTHIFTSPFYWDGTSNIVIQTSFTMLASELRNASVYYTDTTVDRALFYRSDGTAWNTETTGILSSNRPNMMLHIDEPLAGPPAAPILVYPADATTALPIDGFEFRWVADYFNGGVPEHYVLFLSDNVDEIYEQDSWETSNTRFNPVLEDPTFSFDYSHYYYWTVSAVIGEDDAVASPPRSFVIETDPSIVALPHEENFDAVITPNLPRGWTAYKSNSGSTINTSTSQSQTPENSVYMSTRITGETMQLITPPVTVPINTIRLSFWLRASGTTNYSMKVGTVNATDGSGVFTQVAEVFPSSSFTWELHEVSFVNYTGTDDYICFQPGTNATYRTYYLDSVRFDEIHAVDLQAVALVCPSLAKVGLQLTHNLRVRNYGLDPVSNYTVNLKDGNDNTLGSTVVTEALAPEATTEISINWTPTTAGTYDVYAEVVVTGDGNEGNNTTATQSVTVYTENAEFMPIGATDSVSTVNYAPFDCWFEGFVAETVYLASEIQATGGTIRALVYYNDFITDWTFPAQIWMKNTDVANLSAGWPVWDGYVQVYNGSLYVPAGINEVVIPLTTPFSYTGGNLSIRTTKTYQEDWVSGNNWITTPDANYPNRTRYYRSTTQGSVDYTNPSEGYVENNVPNITFIMDPATLVTELDTPVVDVTISDTNAVLDWAAIPYAYSYRVYASEDPYDFGVDPEPVAIVYTDTATVPATLGKSFFKVFSKSYRDYSGRGRSMWNSLLEADITVEDDNPIEKAMKERNIRR